jgi:nucleoside-diphosphate-sugar epimerase
MSAEEPRPPGSAPNPSALPILPVVEPDDEEGPVGEDEPQTILITGASGNVGRKLRAAWQDRYDLILVDAQADPDDPDVIAADLAEWDESWVELFDEADVVVHLAATPDEHSSWEELVRPNMDALANVFHAAATSGVDRLVFASSNHAMGGYRDRPETPIAVDLPPIPGNPYGAAKLWGERLGIALSRAYGLSFVGLRLGWIQRGENRPETLPDAWWRGLWLSNDDAVRLFTRAVEAPLEAGQAVIVNGLSRNRGTRWNLAEAFEAIGFEPEDGTDVGGD